MGADGGSEQQLCPFVAPLTAGALIARQVVSNAMRDALFVTWFPACRNCIERKGCCVHDRGRDPMVDQGEWSHVVSLHPAPAHGSPRLSRRAVDAQMIDAGTRLAVERTRLAYERTLMAWVRTATALISFGFTIYKFFEFEMTKHPVRAVPVLGPRGFAMLMITIGLVSLILSTIEHRRNMQAMRVEFGALPYSTAYIVSALVSAMGLIALVVVAMRG
jgi:putative membrane protein